MQHVTITLLLPAAAPLVYFVSVGYDVTELDGGRWQYEYTIINDLSASFKIKTVFINFMTGNILAPNALATQRHGVQKYFQEV